jgi:hypothetical protein
MLRLVVLLSMCTILIGGAVLAEDDDPIGTKLATAKGVYPKELAKARGALVDVLKREAEAAQKAGDLKTLEKIDDEIKALEDKGTLPKSVPTTVYNSDVRKARSKLKDAYADAVKAYTKDGKRTQAKAAQQDLDELNMENAVAPSKPSSGDDGFQVGTKLAGTNRSQWVVNGKKMIDGYDQEFEVTKRSGKEFTAAIWFKDRKVGIEVEGTIDNKVCKYKPTKFLTDNNAGNVIGENVFKGRFENGSLKGVVTKKSDPTFKAEVELKLKKE